MKKIAIGISLLIALMLFAGCTDMLTMNIFESFDTPVTPSPDDIGEMDTVDLLNVVGDLIESDTFYEDLTEDTKDALILKLSVVFLDNSGDTPVEQRQEAAILTVDIVLNTTDAGDVVGGITEVLNELVTAGGIPEGTDPDVFIADLIEQIFGGVIPIASLGVAPKATDIYIGLEQFTAIIMAIQQAADAHRTFGDLLSDIDGVAGVDVPPGFNIGQIAQDAVVTIIVSNTIDEIGIEPLWEIIFGDGAVTLTMTNNPLDDPALLNIIEAAGLGDLLSELLTSGGTS
jgi:hypothetical protein